MKALGRRDDAINDYRKALELKPSDEARRAAELGLRDLGRSPGTRQK
jgi:predicted TPR repeat methyltransferase